MGTPNITMAYVQGIQASLAEAGLVNYASEEQALEDAADLGSAVEDNISVDRGGLASEGSDPEETHALAKAIVDLAVASGGGDERAEILDDTVNKLASLRPTRISKFAMEAGSPSDNNVVAGHKPGSVAAGESSAKSTDLNKELVNAVSNTAHREDTFSSKPGQSALAGRGRSGEESGHPGADAQGGVVEDTDELSNAVSNDRERPNYHGAPGSQSDKDSGRSGEEKSASARLSRVLARL